METLAADLPERLGHTETTASKARLRLWLRLLKAQKQIEGQVREFLRQSHDTTLPRFDVLAALYRTRDGMMMGALSGELKVSNGNVTGIVDRLVADDLVERVPVEGDRRAMKVRLTPEGRTTFETQAEAHEALIDRLLGGLGVDEADALSTALLGIAETAEQSIETHSATSRTQE
ncbi:MAG: MarR family transcriptional regulator [Pseudomonadota bacterium]